MLTTAAADVAVICWTQQQALLCMQWHAHVGSEKDRVTTSFVSQTIPPGNRPPVAGSISLHWLTCQAYGLQAVIDKVRQRVSSEDFSHFKQQSALFMQGNATAKEFHTQVVSLGLASLLPDLAALCPDGTKRTHLLEVHRATFIQDGATKVSHTPCPKALQPIQ